MIGWDVLIRRWRRGSILGRALSVLVRGELGVSSWAWDWGKVRGIVSRDYTLRKR